MPGSQGAAHRGDGWSLGSAGRRYRSDGALHGSGWQCSDPDATRTVSRGGAANARTRESPLFRPGSEWSRRVMIGMQATARAARAVAWLPHFATAAFLFL